MTATRSTLFVLLSASSALAQQSPRPLARAATELSGRHPNVSASIRADGVTATIDLGTSTWWKRGTHVAFMEPYVALVLAANEEERTPLHLVVVVRGKEPLGEEPPTELFARCDRAAQSAWGWLAKNAKHRRQVTYELRCMPLGSESAG